MPALGRSDVVEPERQAEPSEGVLQSVGVLVPRVADDPQRHSPTPVLARPAGEDLGHRRMELLVRVIQRMERNVIDLAKDRARTTGSLALKSAHVETRSR